MRIVHLPYYDENPYQDLLMESQRQLGHVVWEGGGGGNFLGVALRGWKADVVHFHWIHPYLLRDSWLGSIVRSFRFLAEVAILKVRGARIVWTIHNLVNHDGRHAAIERWFSACFANLCVKCFVHSKAAAVAAATQFRIPRSKLEVIPHGNYVGVYPNEVSRAEARTQLGLPCGCRVFLFLGRIETYKGVQQLIDAFQSLKGDSHLVIAGRLAAPALLEEIQRWIADHPRIHLHARRVPDDELQVFFKAADVVVFPFRRILTSGSLVLAMSFGKAVVVPRLAAMEEVLPEEGVRWFEPGEPSSLGAALGDCLDSDTAEGGLSNLAVARNWTWDSVSEQIFRALGAGR